MTDAKKIDVQTLPVLPLRDVVVFPNSVMPLFVGREKSIRALEEAVNKDKKILLCAQKDPAVDQLTVKDLHDVGTVASVLQLLKLPDGTVKVLVEGLDRGIVQEHAMHEDDFFMASVVEASADKNLISTIDPSSAEGLAELGMGAQAEPLVNIARNHFKEFVGLSGKIPPEILATFNDIKDAGRAADTIAAHLSLDLTQKQKILETIEPTERLNLLIEKLVSEIEKLKIEEEVQGRIKDQMGENQRRYYLNEKLAAIQKELGADENDVEKLSEKIAESGMSEEAREKAEAELAKLKLMSPMSAEASVSRTYVETLIKLPWKKKSKLRKDINAAQDILNHDHYGLEKIKERILEFLAVQQRVKKLKGPILCLVGPPGVGKTSLGESIARATGRKFVRFALGGVRDEAEIRGHRRTYIGALTGKILQKISKVNVKNPLFLLDEIDKMSMDFRGDPASALLEVLDPEQNSTFNDHYLEVDFDLSDVMFVATANTLNTVPSALLDRMEVIRLSGYTEDEKVNISKQYLIPKQLEANGLAKGELHFVESSLRDIIRYYTREAGVRNLEREIAKVCRKVVRQDLAKGEQTTSKITQKSLEKYLGVKKYHYGLADENDQVGQVTGLAWTEVGGELLKIEGAVVPGKGKYITTGSLGDVMQESITAASTVARMRQELMGLDDDYFDKHDFHIHVPEGATPKDGPSAGIGMCTVLVSILTDSPVRADFAMTGEITLRGEVLPIGGLKEKLLAAHRGGIKNVIIPQQNEKDLKEIPKNVTENLNIIPVQWIDEVLDLVLVRKAKTKRKKAASSGRIKSKNVTTGKRSGARRTH